MYLPLSNHREKFHHENHLSLGGTYHIHLKETYIDFPVRISSLAENLIRRALRTKHPSYVFSFPANPAIKGFLAAF